MSLDELYRETILEHSQSPSNKRVLDPADRQARGYNPLCGDDLTVYLALDGDRIAEATFIGRGCAICEASASLLTEAVAGRPIAEALALAGAVETLVRTGRSQADLGPIQALGGVHRFAARVKCATLAWKSLQQALAGWGTEQG